MTLDYIYTSNSCASFLPIDIMPTTSSSTFVPIIPARTSSKRKGESLDEKCKASQEISLEDQRDGLTYQIAESRKKIKPQQSGNSE